MDNSALDFLNKLQLTNNVFVDVGANDGQTNSMTLSLENKGWAGLLIEPNPSLAKLLELGRKNKVINCAITESVGSLDFYLVSGPENLHGLSRFDFTPEFEKHVQSHGGKVTKEKVNTKTLNDILQANNLPSDFSFLKVDVEGHELSVFKSLNLNFYEPKFIVAEDNTKDKNKAVRKYLKSFGYKVIARNGTNNFYCKKINNVFLLFHSVAASVTFLRWDLKRFFYKIVGREFKSNYI